MVSVTYGYPMTADDVSGKFYYRRFCNNYAVCFGIMSYIGIIQCNIGILQC